MKTHHLLVPAFLLGVMGIALADTERQKGIISQIASKLDYAASELASMERKSDASDVDDALNYVYEVERLVDELGKVPALDREAEGIVSTYPRIIKEFRSAADELKKIKLRHPAASAYKTQCIAFDKEMTARAQGTKDDPRGAEDLSDFAKVVGRKAEDLMAEATRMASEVERSRNEVRRFSATERWNGIRSNLHSSADAIAQDWSVNFEQARRDCAEPVKRERHHEVEKALGRLAGSRAGREQLKSKIYELLALVASRIYEVHRQSDASYVNGAIEITKEIDSQLERLSVAAGGDRESQQLASSGPSQMRNLRHSLDALKDLKFNQNRADDGFGKCDGAEKALQEKIRLYLADPTQHERAIRDLPDEAERVGAPIMTGINKASEVDRQMHSWYSAARSFSNSDAGFAAITSNLHASAGKVFDHWRAEFVSMTRACARLVLGKQHPDVAAAVAEMSRDTKTAGDSYRSLRDEFNRWKAEVDKLRDWSAKDVEEIRLEFCAATDHDEVLDNVNQIADRWATQLKGQYGTITGTADRIKNAADALIAKKRALKAAPKTKDAVNEILESISKLKGAQLEGSNNPLLKAQSQYGTDRHIAIQRSCDASEIEISSAYCQNPNPKRRDCKLDCVRGCKIIEIKPDNAAAVALGQQQANAYKKGLEKMFEGLGESMFKEGRFAVFSKCMSSDKKELKLEALVERYSFCPSAEQIGPTLSRPNPSIPSDAE